MSLRKGHGISRTRYRGSRVKDRGKRCQDCLDLTIDGVKSDTPLFPEPYEYIKPYKKWLKSNDHIVCKFPKKLIDNQAGFTGRIQSSHNKDRHEAVGFKRKNIEEMHPKKDKQGLPIGAQVASSEGFSSCHQCCVFQSQKPHGMKIK